MVIQVTSWRTAAIFIVELEDCATVGDVADKARSYFRVRNAATLQRTDDEIMISRNASADELEDGASYELAETAGGV